MTKAAAVKTAKSFFERYADQNSFHITADGKAFFEAGTARLHAKTLEDKGVVEVKRSDCDLKAPVKDEVVKEDVVLIEEKTDDNTADDTADKSTAETIDASNLLPAQVDAIAKQQNKGRGKRK